VQFGPLYNRQTLFAAFVQDEWRLTRKLTLSLGLRYELFSPLVEKFDRQANPNIANPLTAPGPVQPGRDHRQEGHHSGTRLHSIPHVVL